MAQAITDVKTFLEDARQAVVELAEFEKQEETLAQEEKKRLRVLETERKAVADAVNSTVKRRRDEIEKSYDDELGKLQDKLCLLYTSPSPRDAHESRMPSSA